MFRRIISRTASGRPVVMSYTIQVHSPRYTGLYIQYILMLAYLMYFNTIARRVALLLLMLLLLKALHRRRWLMTSLRVPLAAAPELDRPTHQFGFVGRRRRRSVAATTARHDAVQWPLISSASLACRLFPVCLVCRRVARCCS